MTYEINLKILIKTMGKELTHSEMRNLIDKALWGIDEFRDVDIFDYQGDTLEDPNPFSDIRQEILEP